MTIRKKGQKKAKRKAEKRENHLKSRVFGLLRMQEIQERKKQRKAKRLQKETEKEPRIKTEDNVAQRKYVEKAQTKARLDMLIEGKNKNADKQKIKTVVLDFKRMQKEFLDKMYPLRRKFWSGESHVPRSRGLTREQKQEERFVNTVDYQQESLLAKWGRKLALHGWVNSSRGWQKDNVAHMPIGSAIVVLNRSLRDDKAREEAAIPDYLEAHGWVCGPNNIWMIANWKKPEGFCYRTLKQAYKIQLGMKPQEVQS